MGDIYGCILDDCTHRLAVRDPCGTFSELLPRRASEYRTAWNRITLAGAIDEQGHGRAVRNPLASRLRLGCYRRVCGSDRRFALWRVLQWHIQQENSGWNGRNEELSRGITDHF